MRILSLRAYYAPEKTAGSHLTDDINEAFAKAGITCTYITPMPTRGVTEDVRRAYRQRKEETALDGHIIVRRFSMFREGRNPLLRALRYVLCCVAQYWLGCKEKDVDALMVGSTPPIQGMLAALVSKTLSKKHKKKVPFVYELQDIFPDSLVTAKMTEKGSLIWKIGRKIEDYTYRNADKIIVISEDFKRNIMEKGVPEEKIVVIPNWVNTDNVYSVERKDNILFERYHLDPDKYYICYSGNIGHSQNLPLLLEAAKKLQETLADVHFVLVGEGAAKAELEKIIAEQNMQNITLLPFQPYEEIAHVFSLGDVGLIMSKPGVGSSSVPSKTWGIMAAERPVLASFDVDSELHQVIDRVGCGVCADPNSVDALIQGVYKLHTDQAAAKAMGKKGRRYVREALDKDVCTGQYVKELLNTYQCEKVPI